MRINIIQEKGREGIIVPVDEVIQPNQKQSVIYLLPRMSLADTPMLGVRKKILSQARAFQFAGFGVEIVDTPEALPSRNGRERTETGSLGEIFQLVLKWPLQFGQNLARNIRNAFNVLQRIRQSGKVILYVRHTSASPGLIAFHLALRILSNVERIYLEIPTWPYQHENTSGWKDRICLPLLSPLVQRVVTFSSSTNILGVKTINITNGVSVEDAPLVPPALESDRPYRLIFVGQLNFWTGIDRLLLGLANFLQQEQNRSMVVVNIVGDGLMFADWKKLAIELGVDDNVTFHGNCSGESLNKIYEGSHVAFGNLANHRRKLSQNADLKNREYCLRGLPFIVASDDLAFPTSFQFRKIVSANDLPLDIQESIDFFASVSRLEPDYRNVMRNFALTNFRWEVTMDPVIKDMMSVNR